MEDDRTQILNRDFSLMKIAKLMARRSNARNFKMGAVVARGRKVIGLGANDVIKTHPRSNTPHGHIHAELSAILNARQDVNGTTLYIFRAGKDEDPLLAKPCRNCQALLKKEGIKTVVYSNYKNNGSLTKELVHNLCQ
jgi:deoxycytidylate deaminase